MTNKKPIIYIASAYTKGDPAVNVHFQCKVFDDLMNDGLVWPFIPLFSHFVHTVCPRPYSDWINYDNALLPLFDGCLRLIVTCYRLQDYRVAESSGADAEVAYFRANNKPVFFSKEELYAWLENYAL
jgi:hypothetical protein